LGSVAARSRSNRYFRKMDDCIFVSVAAYRDPQLEATLLDCLRKARRPSRLRFGICWQRDSSDIAPDIFADPRLRVLDVPWQASQGACWARAEIMKLWHGEQWYLQIDSHCRFADGWDERLEQMIAETGSPQAILSTYASPFTPDKHERLVGPPLQINFQAFTDDGILQLKPGPIPGDRQSGRPVRARFIAAGFIFAEGTFVERVPYDPELYFMGEETALTVRAFTNGYDLFHPAEAVVWHDYIRADARKHWGDHTPESDAGTDWKALDQASRLKVQRLLRAEPVEDFGLGPVRSLGDYESYAGLSFRLRKAQRYTVRAEEPPNPAVAEDWPEHIYPWIARVRLKRAQLPAGSLEQPALWSLSIQDEFGIEIHRRDLSQDELKPLLGEEEELALVCEFQSETIPARWSIWILNRSNDWLPRLTGTLEDGDFAILNEDEVLPSSA
jgi:hypothetical protein